MINDQSLFKDNPMIISVSYVKKFIIYVIIMFEHISLGRQLTSSLLRL